MPQALIFDVDGTLADTEQWHLAAFNHAFRVEGLDWHWDVPHYTRLLEVSGGKERILHHWREVQPGLRDLDGQGVAATVERLHALKTAAYEEAVRDGALTLRPGVPALIEEAAVAGVRLAIATTTSPANVAVLMRQALGADWRRRFEVVEDASTAPLKKPHPQVYRNTLRRLGLAPEGCLALEDSANGLRAATAAGLATVVTPNAFTAHHDFAGALCVLPDLSGVRLRDLRARLEQPA
ncbi:HAD-IA family hydrolase [Macromonas nakdongensis]|uniref:HAD-IA family hydrolase n=1 Tax=Macromonas nakdongensis TaxID=1843082 RepID=UPI000C348250|nr:HAD-IA family hydrolase [Macromonas nakdongensis]